MTKLVTCASRSKVPTVISDNIQIHRKEILPEGTRLRGGSSLEVLSGIRNRAGLSSGGSTVGISSSHSIPLK